MASAYAVELTDEAFSAYVALPTKRAFEGVDADLGRLGEFPYLGGEYRPIYHAAVPAFSCRVLYSGNYGIYYRVDEVSETVTVFAIEDQRRNPETRFSSYRHYLVTLDDEEQLR